MTDSAREKRYTGDVVKKPFATGSKSERNAVMLSTRWGDFVLRRVDAHARDGRRAQSHAVLIPADGKVSLFVSVP